MSVETVRAYLEPFGLSDRVREFDTSSATVELAAQAAGEQGIVHEGHGFGSDHFPFLARQQT